MNLPAIAPALVIRSVSAAICVLFLGCEVPQPPAGHDARSGPPEPVHLDPKSEEGKALAAAIAKKQSKKNTNEKAGEEVGDEEDADVKPIESRSPLPAGFITTPINAYFSAKERLNEMQINRSLQTFRQLKGRKPKDMDEVREKILKPIGVELPDLKEGDTYRFVPEEGRDGAIMIQQAKK